MVVSKIRAEGDFPTLLTLTAPTQSYRAPLTSSSLGAQRYDRIHARRAAGWNPASDERGDGEEAGARDQRDGIGGADLVEHPPEDGSGAERQQYSAHGAD